MTNNIDLLSKKICTKNTLVNLLACWKFKNQKIVFTNGCFDIIHRGHVDYLARTADYGDIMVVGLNSDSSVKKIKGNNRPIQDEKTRAMILSSMFFIDHIIIFDEETPYNLINFIQPDVLVKGSDYKPENIIGSDIVLAKGGKIETIDFVEGHSTTSIIDKLYNK